MAASGGPAADLAVVDILRALSTGASGSILMALGRGPLRTKRLTERLPQYAPRTVYRNLSKLVELGVVERVEEAGVPSAVVYRLTQPCGRALFRLLDAHALTLNACQARGQLDDAWWTAIRLMAEAWESGWVELLSLYARSPTEIAERTGGLTFHQVSRRVNHLRSNRLLVEVPSRGIGKRYRLTDKARRVIVLLMAVAKWRRRHLTAGTSTDLTVSNAITALRVWIPLMKIDRFPEKAVKFGVAGVLDQEGTSGSEILLCRIAKDGTVTCSVNSDSDADGWALGTVHAWLGAALNGSCRLRVGGDLDLVNGCLYQLHHSIWRKPDPSLVGN